MKSTIQKRMSYKGLTPKGDGRLIFNPPSKTGQAVTDLVITRESLYTAFKLINIEVDSAEHYKSTSLLKALGIEIRD